jgi:hypothetical protein
LKGIAFFEAARSVRKNNSSLKPKHQIKLSLSKCLIHTVAGIESKALQNPKIFENDNSKISETGSSELAVKNC